jgi:Fe2+ or Zn2+ uptake regulation protein
LAVAVNIVLVVIIKKAYRHYHHHHHHHHYCAEIKNAASCTCTIHTLLLRAQELQLTDDLLREGMELTYLAQDVV